MFSKACEYAIKAMIYIESDGDKDKKISLNEIAAAIDSPVAFTAKILQQLKKSGLLISTIGAKGGFQTRRDRQVNIKEIITAIDGEHLFTECILGLKTCSSINPCPMHEKFMKIKMALLQLTEGSNLTEFSESINNRTVLLK
jgi:Rrf2 family iron-sulfur cluster assembly transcriptional regulator